MKKRLLSMLICCVMLVGLMPTAVFAEDSIGGKQASSANSGTYRQSSNGSGGTILGKYTFYVAGVEVSEYQLSGKGWSFDPDTDTLTLSNFNASGIYNAYFIEDERVTRYGARGDEVNIGAFIYIDAHYLDNCNLNIVLANGTENNIGGEAYSVESAVTYKSGLDKYEGEAYFGIYAPGANIKISGEGQLEIGSHIAGIKAKNLEFDTSGNKVNIRSYANSLYVTGTLTFKGKSIVQTRSYVSNTAIQDSKWDIFCIGRVSVKDNAYVNAIKCRENYKTLKEEFGTIWAGGGFYVDGGKLSALFYDDCKGSTEDGLANTAISAYHDSEICGGGEVTALVNSNNKKKKTTSYAINSSNTEGAAINFTGDGVIRCGVRAVDDTASSDILFKNVNVFYPKRANLVKSKGPYEDYDKYEEHRVTAPQGIYLRQKNNKQEWSFFSDFQNADSLDGYSESASEAANLSSAGRNLNKIIADNPDLPIYIVSGKLYFSPQTDNGDTFHLKQPIEIKKEAELVVGGDGIADGLHATGNGKITFIGATIQGKVDDTVEMIVDGGNINVEYKKGYTYNSKGEDVFYTKYSFSSDKSYNKIEFIGMKNGSNYGCIGIYPFDGKEVYIWCNNVNPVSTARATRKDEKEDKNITVDLYCVTEGSTVLVEGGDIKLSPAAFWVANPGDDIQIKTFYEFRSANISPYNLKWSYSDDGIEWTDIENPNMDSHGNMTIEKVTEDLNGRLYRCEIYSKETGALLTTYSGSIYIYIPILEAEESYAEGTEVTLRVVPKYPAPSDFISYTIWRYSGDGGNRFYFISDSDSCTFTANEDVDGRIYECITNGSNGYYTGTDKITFRYTMKVTEKKVKIEEQPENEQWIDLNNSEEASLSVKARNATKYQWQVSKRASVSQENVPFEDIPGATSSTYSFMSDSITLDTKNYVYRCVVSNDYSEVVSDEVFFNARYKLFVSGVENKMTVSVGEEAQVAIYINPGNPIVSNSVTWEISKDGGVTYEDYFDALKEIDYNVTGLLWRLPDTNIKYLTSYGLIINQVTKDMDGWIFRYTLKAEDEIVEQNTAKLTVHEHDYKTEWSSDESNHWHECSMCGNKKDETAHVYDKEVVSDDYLKTAATCTDKAVYYKSCVCGKSSKGTENEATFENGDVLGHSFGEWKSNNDGTHTRVCENDASHIETADCTFDWVIDKEATIKEIGKKHEECADCRYKKNSVEIPRLVLLGDVDGNGVIDTIDVLVLNQYMAKINVEYYEQNCDLNADGVIDTNDSLILIQYLAELNVKFIKK